MPEFLQSWQARLADWVLSMPLCKQESMLGMDEGLSVHFPSCMVSDRSTDMGGIFLAS